MDKAKYHQINLLNHHLLNTNKILWQTLHEYYDVINITPNVVLFFNLTNYGRGTLKLRMLSVVS